MDTSRPLVVKGQKNRERETFSLQKMKARQNIGGVGVGECHLTVLSSELWWKTIVYL